MSSSLFLQEFLPCLVRFTWIVSWEVSGQASAVLWNVASRIFLKWDIIVASFNPRLSTPAATYTHTHTHTYIYIYIYI